LALLKYIKTNIERGDADYGVGIKLGS